MEKLLQLQKLYQKQNTMLTLITFLLTACCIGNILVNIYIWKQIVVPLFIFPYSLSFFLQPILNLNPTISLTDKLNYNKLVCSPSECSLQVIGDPHWEGSF